jgi:hypothetical protein
VIWVESHHGDDYLNFISKSFDKRWAKWPIDQTTSKNRFFTWSTLTSKERSWDSACGVHPLFDIHCQWEEVE